MAVIFVSVLLENIAPIISWSSSVVCISDVSAIVPVVAGKVAVMLPLNALCAGAWSRA